MSTTIIFLVFFFLYFLFIYKTGTTFPIMYLFVFVYFIQYVFSVYLIFNEYPVLKKEMTIGEDKLFEFTIPALMFLFVGVFAFNRDVNIRESVKTIDPGSAEKLGHLLLIISFFFDALSFAGVSGIRSITSFTGPLKLVGGMCYLFAPSARNYFLLAFVYLGLARDALGGGVFIDFFMWTAYLFLVVCLRYRFSFALKSSFILLSAPLLILIQSVKSEYRDASWSGKRESGVGLLTELIAQKQEKENDPFAKSEGVVSTIGRLNQGWQLGLVLKWVPRHEAFSNGADLLSDLEGVLLPRIFFPDKKIIGSQDKFEKFTGHKMQKGTSMTIGILGDFYINFGTWGAYIALFILGALMARILYWFVSKYVLSDAINMVWIPYLFSYLVRANNDFYIVANNLFKGFLIFLFIQYLRKQLWPAHFLRM